MMKNEKRRAKGEFFWYVSIKSFLQKKKTPLLAPLRVDQTTTVALLLLILTKLRPLLAQVVKMTKYKNKARYRP